MNEKQYAWYFDNLSASSEPCNSIDECLKEARQENNGEYEKVFIGTVEYIEGKIDVDVLIENIQDDVYRDTEDNIEDYLEDVTYEEKEELNLLLNEVFDKWKKKNQYELDFYFVKDAKAYNL
ncbi:hypothetical protein [Sebaldella sp. S0638]|uniref:hypothetical protein n=1 Tax=Sebaldella sp. S0638 TaxID=2957809 RepID=UPI00209DD4D4|nr:hypothetical protein [Sebaldella sp. S0638]MCP1226157.1 hypothetical protein [Sebaldella sp. S0638]